MIDVHCCACFLTCAYVSQLFAIRSLVLGRSILSDCTCSQACAICYTPSIPCTSAIFGNLADVTDDDSVDAPYEAFATFQFFLFTVTWLEQESPG